MKIDLYTRCWNDADMLGFFFRHYDRFVQRYFIYDDGSTDASLEILDAHPNVEIRQMPKYSDPDSRTLSALALQEECWKESRGFADWVIVTDIDEHLHHRDIKNYLATSKSQGVTIIPALGFSMLSDEFPQTDLLLCETLTMGAPKIDECKMSIFSPDDIEATNFQAGRHSANPKGNVITPACDELLMLHYKYIGFERLLRRHEQYLTRQRKKDIENGFGEQYSWSREQMQNVWSECKSQLIDITHFALSPEDMSELLIWWKGFQRAAPLKSCG